MAFPRGNFISNDATGQHAQRRRSYILVLLQFLTNSGPSARPSARLAAMTAIAGLIARISAVVAPLSIVGITPFRRSILWIQCAWLRWRHHKALWLRAPSVGRAPTAFWAAIIAAVGLVLVLVVIGRSISLGRRRVVSRILVLQKH